MDCKDIKALIGKETDGIISSGELELLEAHVKGCPSCMRERQEQARLHGLLRENFAAVKVPGLPPDFDRRFYARIARLEEEAKPSFISGIAGLFTGQSELFTRTKLAAVAITVLIAVVAGVRYYGRFATGLPGTDTGAGITVNSTALYTVIRESAESRDEKEEAARQAKEIVALAGIRG